MKLGRRAHTVGDKRRYVVDYAQWLDPGVTINSVVITSSSETAIIVGTTVLPENKVEFFIQGGVLAETFTVSIQMTDTVSQIKNDTLDLFVVAP